MGVTNSATVRASLFIAKLMGAIFLTAVFFEQTGATATPECDPENQTTGQVVAQAVVVAVLSTMLSTVPQSVIAAFQCRGFVYKEYWTEEERRRQVCLWRCYDYIFYVISLSYLSFVVTFMLCFLASANLAGEQSFISALATVIGREFILTPVMLSLVVACWATMIYRHNNKLVDHVYDEVGKIVMKNSSGGGKEDRIFYPRPNKDFQQHVVVGRAPGGKGFGRPQRPQQPDPHSFPQRSAVATLKGARGEGILAAHPHAPRWDPECDPHSPPWVRGGSPEIEEIEEISLT